MEEKALNISVSSNEIKAVAADLISIEFNNSYAVLSFVQTYRSMSEKESEELTLNGVVTSRVMLSWEHLARFSFELANFIKSTRSEAEKNSKKAFEIANGIKKMTEAKDE